eukprot:scaffold7.g3615.t1
MGLSDLPEELRVAGSPSPPVDLFAEGPVEASAFSTDSKGSRITRLVSLLDPPPGFDLSNLTQAGCAAVCCVAAQRDNIPRLRQLRQGTGTVVADRDYFKDHFVGVPTSLYGQGELCSVCVRIWCTDAVCEEALVNNATFIIADSSRSSNGSNLVVSARGFRNLTGVDYNINPTLLIAWTFADCAPLIQGEFFFALPLCPGRRASPRALLACAAGGIKLLPSPNMRPDFLAINLSNSRALLRSVSINNLPLQRTSYGMWVIDTPGKNIDIKPPYSLLLTSSTGRRLAQSRPRALPHRRGGNRRPTATTLIETVENLFAQARESPPGGSVDQAAPQDPQRAAMPFRASAPQCTAGATACLAAALLLLLSAAPIASGAAPPAFVADGQQQAGTDVFGSADGAAAVSPPPGPNTLLPPADGALDDSADLTASPPPPPGYGLVAGPPGSELKRLRSAGTGTNAYDELPMASSGAMSLSCGLGYAAYIGIGSSYFQKGYSCGRCVRVQARRDACQRPARPQPKQCDDLSCARPGAQLVAQVVDLCGDCFDADLALATPLFLNLTGRELGSNPTIQLSWEFTDCIPYINGTIKMLVKPNGNAYYQAFNFANSLYPIVAVQINGDRLKHNTDNYWEWNPGKAISARGPFDLAFQASNTQVLRVRLTQLRSQDLKVQFRQPPWPHQSSLCQPRQQGMLAAARGGGSSGGSGKERRRVSVRRPAQEQAGAAVQQQAAARAAHGSGDEQGTNVALLPLDHMRDRAGYSRLIRSWAGELGLSGRLLFLGSGGGAVVLLLLEGPAAALREYLVRHRTQNVDVDSKGRPCRERMMSVVCEEARAGRSFPEGFGEEALGSMAELEALLEREGLAGWAQVATGLPAAAPGR